MSPVADRCLVDDTIFEATIQVLAKEGYDGATTRKIAEEADVNEVTLFRKFKNKENLVKQASLWNLKRSMAGMDRLFDFDSPGDFRSSLIELGKRISGKIDDRTNLMIVSIGEMQRLPAKERIQPKYSTHMLDRLTEYFKRQIELGNMRAVDPRIAASDFYGHIFFMNFVRKINGLLPANSDERSLEAFIDIFLNGVQANKP